jgi:hypothetical protein
MGEVHQHPAVFGNLGGGGVLGGRAAPVAASGAGTTGAVAATLLGAANRLTHITAFHVGELGTGGAAVTVSGLAGGSLTFEVSAPGMLNFQFNPPLPASALNTAIVVTAAANASATAVAVAATGF